MLDQRTAALWMAAILPTLGFADTYNPTNAPFDELLFHLQRYGNTPARLERKEASRQEFLRREASSLQYLMNQIHIDNFWIRIMVHQVTKSAEDHQAADVLVEFLESDHEETRKHAAYYLGFTMAPDFADRVLPLLQDEAAAGAAMRTLGKWRIEGATTEIIPFLGHDEERKRVLAANALRDIGDPRAVPDLITSLGDPMFTVRNTSARALSSLGKVAEKSILKELKTGDHEIVVKRQMIRILGEMKSRRAKTTLKRLGRDEDPGVRFDARKALDRIASATR